MGVENRGARLGLVPEARCVGIVDVSDEGDPTGGGSCGVYVLTMRTLVNPSG